MSDLQENVVTGSFDEFEANQLEDEDYKVADNAIHSEVLDSLEKSSPSSTTNGGIEEVALSEQSAPIADGFVAGVESTKTTGINYSSTPSTEEGFEEVEHKEQAPDKKDNSLKSPLALWIIKQNFHPSVVRLIYWVELQKSAGVFVGIMFLLISASMYSLIGVITTFGMSVLVVAFLYRIGMTIVTAVQKTSAEHPFKHLLEDKIELSEECVLEFSSKARVNINALISYMQGLFLVKDTVASLKALVILWLTSYVAGSINLITVVMWGVVLIFTIPKLYEEKQAQIDKVFSLAMSKICAVCGVIEQKIPEKIKAYMRKDKKE